MNMVDMVYLFVMVGFISFSLKSLLEAYLLKNTALALVSFVSIQLLYVFSGLVNGMVGGND